MKFTNLDKFAKSLTRLLDLNTLFEITKQVIRIHFIQFPKIS